MYLSVKVPVSAANGYQGTEDGEYQQSRYHHSYNFKPPILGTTSFHGSL